MTLTKFFDDVYRPLRLRGRSQNTTRLYHATIAAFRRWLVAEGIAAEPALEHLDELLLARYLEHRASTRSPYTAEKERSQLMSLARLANERRLIERLPTCPPGVLPDKIPTAWSAEELRRLFNAASQARGRVCGIPAATMSDTRCCVISKWPSTGRFPRMSPPAMSKPSSSSIRGTTKGEPGRLASAPG